MRLRSNEIKEYKKQNENAFGKNKLIEDYTLKEIVKECNAHPCVCTRDCPFYNEKTEDCYLLSYNIFNTSPNDISYAFSDINNAIRKQSK